MTSSQIRGTSEQIDNGIKIQRRRLADAKQAFSKAVTALGNYPTEFEDYLVTVDAYLPTGPSEELAKDIRAKQIAEFQALQVSAENAQSFLSGISEF